MRGMLEKEFLYTKRQNPLTWVILPLCICGMWSVKRPGTLTCGMNICTIVFVLTFGQLVNIPFCDGKCRWDWFARSLPVSSRKIVGGRYLCAAIGVAAGTLLSVTGELALGGPAEPGTLFYLCAVCTSVPAILYAICLPLGYLIPFRVVGVASIPVLLVMAFCNISIQYGKFGGTFSRLPLPALSAGAVVIFAASFFLSVQIYSRKEI